jgi:phosphate/phosphite/phosphonate ABC transporter binding protein
MAKTPAFSFSWVARPARFALIAIALSVARPAAAQFSFGVVPQQSASELARLWTPILAYLNEKTHMALEFHTAKDIPTFEQRLAVGEYDFAYMNPYHYAVFHDFSGYRAFAKEKGRKLVGLIVVRKNSPVNNIAELQGQQMALPAPAAFAASMLPYATLKSRGISVKPRYVSSHDSVYLAVTKGMFPAGGGIARTFENLEPSVRDQLRILWSTRPYTPHAIAAHPRVRLER